MRQHNVDYECYRRYFNEEMILIKNGYKKLDKICDTLQGELFKGRRMLNNQYVAIKKTDKSQFDQQIAIHGGFNYVVTENRLKEALILKYLTIDNNPIGEYIVKYIDFFESDTHYYLITEYIDSEMNLKQFIKYAHQYINNGRLKLKEYKKIIKYLYWTLAVTIHWLHNDMNCCHLDICGENILLPNGSFIEGTDGNLSINPTISLKLTDFGVSELFKPDQSTRSLKKFKPFRCNKQHLTIYNESYLAPKILDDEPYDARSADMWSLGMILYECMTGKPLYGPTVPWQILSSCSLSSSSSDNNGYYALIHGELYKYLLKTIVFKKYFNSDSFALLNDLLNMNENIRIDAIDVLKHKWFSFYYKRYHKQIQQKTMSQNKRFIENKVKMKHFPFYKL